MKETDNDEDFLRQFDDRVGKDRHDAYMAERSRNLSVRVVDALNSKRRNRRVAVQAGLAGLVSVSTAVVLFFVIPRTPEVPVIVPDVAASETLIKTPTETLAAEYVEDIAEIAAVERLVDDAYSDPLILSDNDIDAFLEDLQ